MSRKKDQTVNELCKQTKKLTITKQPKDDVEENYFYCLGGITKSQYDYIYIKKQKKWYPLAGCQRAYFSCSIIKKKMYLIGGRIDNIPQDNVAVFTNKVWMTMPLLLLNERSEIGVAVIEDKIFIVGGFSKGSRVLEIYDPVNNTVKKGPGLQQSRWGHGVCTIEKTIYAFGGHRKKQYFSSVEKYKVGGELRWTSCDGMNRRRAYFASTALGLYIYVFGGCGGVTNADNVDRLSSAERYDTRTDEWKLIADMPSARSNMSAVKWGKRILIIGGIDNNKKTLRDILTYDPETNSYGVFETRLPDWRFAHASASE